MINKKIAVKWFSVLAFLFMMSASTSLAEPCNGDFGGDGDVDGSDAVLFKKDMGRKNCTNAPVPVPKTGQTTCYDSSGTPRGCAGTGEDGEYQKGVATTPRFTDYGDGTVTDNLTGLMWTKNAHLPASAKTWQEALNYIAGMNGGAGTFGYTDWRLPHIRELHSLIDFGEDVPALPQGHPFMNVQMDLQFDYYWSATTYESYSGGAWVVRMFDGYLNGHYKTSSYFLWPVRGGQ